MENDTTASILGAMLIGFLAGAATGLMLAPAAGEEARRRVQELALRAGDRAVDVVRDYAEDIKGKITEAVEGTS